jgi:hypothetical protein
MSASAADRWRSSQDRAAARLADTEDAFRRWLHLQDTRQVVVALAAVAANLLHGDPLWLLLVGAPGSGKTETIMPLATMPCVHLAATLTEASLLSGVSKKEHEQGATGGLLRQLGDFGIILGKDFSGVLAMNRDTRAQTLAALREVYDGRWDRPVGTGGGRVLSWAGKCGFVGAVTPSIDRHHAVMAALGERFLLYRVEVTDTRAQAHRRLTNRGYETQMRAELTEAVHNVLDQVDIGIPLRALEVDEADTLVDLADFAVKARSAVERDGYDREIVVMPEPEAPARLVGALSSILAGLEAIGANSPTCWEILDKVAWDCIPAMRRRILQHLHEHAGTPESTSTVVAATGIPKRTALYALEDLTLLHLVDGTKSSERDNAAWQWALSEHATTIWPRRVHEMSGTSEALTSHLHVFDDFSCTPTRGDDHDRGLRIAQARAAEVRRRREEAS